MQGAGAAPDPEATLGFGGGAQQVTTDLTVVDLLVTDNTATEQEP